MSPCAESLPRGRHGRRAERAVLGIALLLTLSVPFTAGAQTNTANAKPAPILSLADTDALILLPPPPAPGSEAAKADLVELHLIQTHRSPDDLAHALDSGQHEDAGVFARILGARFDLGHLPATARLLAQVRADDNAAVKRAKSIFQRPRPWVVDPTIIGCPHGDNKPLSSYPSGHSTMIFAAATVLAKLMPDRSQDLFRFAQGYAHDRLVCGHHFQSDVVAGEVYGGVIASDLLHQPALQDEIKAARMELMAAGLTK